MFYKFIENIYLFTDLKGENGKIKNLSFPSFLKMYNFI